MVFRLGQSMRNSFKPSALAAAFTLAFMAQAHAGFIDETAGHAGSLDHAVVHAAAAPSVVKPAPIRQEAQPQAGEVSGATAPGWQDPAPAMKSASVSLLDALVELIPSDQPGLLLAVTATDTSARVHWSAGVTHLQALQQVLLQRGLSASISGDAFDVAPAPKQASVRSAAKPAGPKPVVLTAGRAVGLQLQRIGAARGWTVLWKAPHDWIVPAATTFKGPFASAAQQIVETLAGNGADVRADVYASNKTIVVHAAGGSN